MLTTHNGPILTSFPAPMQPQYSCKVRDDKWPWTGFCDCPPATVMPPLLYMMPCTSHSDVPASDGHTLLPPQRRESLQRKKMGGEYFLGIVAALTPGGDGGMTNDSALQELVSSCCRASAAWCSSNPAWGKIFPSQKTVSKGVSSLYGWRWSCCYHFPPPNKKLSVSFFQHHILPWFLAFQHRKLLFSVFAVSECSFFSFQ